MADRRLIDMTEVTALAGSDLLYLVQQNSVDMKVSLDTFFAKVPSPVKAPSFTPTKTRQLITTDDAIDLTTPNTMISMDVANISVSLGVPAENTEKAIVLLATTGGVATLTGTIAGHTTIKLSHAGDAVLLRYVGGFWFILGGNYTTT